MLRINVGMISCSFMTCGTISEGDIIMAKYKKKLDADIMCPLEYGLTIFGGKSGEYPQKLYKALMNSQTVLTVWDDARLVGLIRVLDDSEMLAQIHYVLVHPEYQGRGIAGRMV